MAAPAVRRWSAAAAMAAAALALASGAPASSMYERGTEGDPNIVMLDGGWVKLPPRDVMLGKPNAPPGEGPPPIMLDQAWAMEHAVITVLVASYRETKCPQTLVNLFTKADHPERVRIGVIQQNKPSEDVDCLEGMCDKLGGGACAYRDQVRMVRMDASEAKGPVFARAQQIRTIREDDDFCMQIDAHTDAVQGWDTQILGEWYETQNEYGVITTYPTEVTHLNENGGGHWTMPYNCHANFAGQAGLVVNTVASTAANMEFPILQPLWAAGLSFARCHAERQVPTDPELKSIFGGEEFGRGSRLWTAGYDFYALRRPVIGTWYGHDKGNHADWRMANQEATASSRRLATMLRWPGSDQSASAVASLGIYGLGQKRSLDQYVAFSGVDTIRQKMDSQCVVSYVPWDWSNDAVAGHKARAALHARRPHAKPADAVAADPVVEAVDNFADPDAEGGNGGGNAGLPVEVGDATAVGAEGREDPYEGKRRAGPNDRVPPDELLQGVEGEEPGFPPAGQRRRRRGVTSAWEIAGGAAAVVGAYYVGSLVVQWLAQPPRKAPHLVV